MPIRRVCLLQGEDHRPSECTLLTSPKEHKQLLITKKLCFNCTGPYKYSECRSVLKYQNCGKRHHTFICDTQRYHKTERVLTALDPENKDIVYPIILVDINGIKTYALLGTGAGSSYTSTKLLNLLNKRPKETVAKRIDTMLGSSTTKVEIYSTTLGAVNRSFDMNIELSKVHEQQLLTVDNPNYSKLLSKYSESTLVALLLLVSLFVMTIHEERFDDNLSSVFITFKEISPWHLICN